MIAPAELWRRLTADKGERRALPAALRAAVRWVLVFYRALSQDRAFERAAALAYGTLLSLVPSMMIVWGVLHATGLFEQDRDQIESLVFGTFLGDIPEVRDVLVPGLNDVNLGAIGAVGTLGWLYVAFRIYMTMEEAYCEMFRVPVTRTLPRRLLHFYVAITAVPVLGLLVYFAIADIADRYGFPLWGTIASVLTPVIVLTMAIKALPNTNVRLVPALLGGAVSGLLVLAGGWAFALYVQTFGSRDPILLIYGSLGIIPVFLFWLYLLWVFVLLGVEVAHVAQDYRSLLRAEREQRLRAEEAGRMPALDTAIEVLAALAQAFRSDGGPVAEKALAERCGLPEHRVLEILRVYATGRYVVRGESGWVVGREPLDVTLHELAEHWHRETTLRRAPTPLGERIGDALRGCLSGTWAEAADAFAGRGSAA